MQTKIINVLVVHNYYNSKIIGGEDVAVDRDVKALQQTQGIRVFRYSAHNDSLNLFSYLLNSFFSFYHFYKVFRLVKKEKIDIVHIHNFYPLLSCSIFFAAKLAGAKIILTLHNYRFWCLSATFSRENHNKCLVCPKRGSTWTGVRKKCFKKSYVQSLLVFLNFRFYRFLNIDRYVDKFQVLSEHQFSLIKKLGISEKRLSMLGHHLDSTNNVSFRKRPFDIKSINCVSIGRVDEDKGFHNIFAIADQVPENVSIHVVGAYDGRFGDIKSFDRIVYHGQLPNSNLFHLMGNCDYLLNASVVFETFGITNIEALRLGMPIIGQKVGSRKEFISHKENGFLYSSGGLLNAIKYMATYTDYERLSENALNSFKKYETSNWRRKQIKIYQDVLFDRPT